MWCAIIYIYSKGKLCSRNIVVGNMLVFFVSARFQISENRRKSTGKLAYGAGQSPGDYQLGTV